MKKKLIKISRREKILTTTQHCVLLDTNRVDLLKGFHFTKERPVINFLVRKIEGFSFLAPARWAAREAKVGNWFYLGECHMWFGSTVGGKGIWEGGNPSFYPSGRHAGQSAGHGLAGHLGRIRWWSVVAASSIPHAMENREFHCGQLHSEYENGGLKRFSELASPSNTLQRAQRNSFAQQ